MFLATSNKAKGLLHLVYIGHVTAVDLQAGHGDVVSLLADLSDGFKMLVDFGRLDSMDTDCVTELGKIMELLDQGGLKQVVRVIPDSSKDIGFKILEVFHYPHRPSSVNCQTMAEAFRLLAI